MPTAALIVIGNEILSGRTEDKNINYIAKELGELGIRFQEVRVIPDIEDVIIETVNALRPEYDYVFTTGGIGPTHDDITSAAIAKAFKVKLERRPEAVKLLSAHYDKTGRELNEARLKMADIPAGAELIDNPISVAPGFRIENVYVMAGVPVIMQAMFDGIRHGLKTGEKILSIEIHTSLPEATIAKDLSDLQARYPTVEMGSYPYFKKGELGTSLVLRSTDAALLREAESELQKCLTALGGQPGK